MADVAGRILVLDFGSQYSHLIVRRCRECGVYAELMRCDSPMQTISDFNAKGIILSGGPASVYEEGAPHATEGFWAYVLNSNIPVLGICYGMQEMQQYFGGEVQNSLKREYGYAVLRVVTSLKDAASTQSESCAADPLFRGLEQNETTVWMSHGDRVTNLAPGFVVIATSDHSEYAAVSDTKRKLWGLQFHPEVTHSVFGRLMLENFLYSICGVCKGSWNMHRFAEDEIKAIRDRVGARHVIGALSGGVDSTVAAALLYQAIGDRFHAFMVDTGLLRMNEGPEVICRLRQQFPGMQIELLSAQEKFFAALAGVKDPETKRKIVGHLFVDTFVEATEALKALAPPDTFKNALLLQGTLYPDVIESVSFRGPSHTIKTHHNVGGLPKRMDLELIEPLRELFKDEVRELGMELGLDRENVWRHPFPGPGLCIRIIGEVTPERVEVLRQADAIFLEELRCSGHYDKIGQAFAVLLPQCRSVGVMGDKRTYGITVCLRAVETSDFMTADWYDLPRDVLKRCSTRIINEIAEVNRVCYDVSSKPPATIEWE